MVSQTRRGAVGVIAGGTRPQQRHDQVVAASELEPPWPWQRGFSARADRRLDPVGRFLVAVDATTHPVAVPDRDHRAAATKRNGDGTQRNVAHHWRGPVQDHGLAGSHATHVEVAPQGADEQLALFSRNPLAREQT